MLKNIVRALRLPFVSASTLPFLFGSLIGKEYFNFGRFLPGLAAVICAHLSANLINDYADSKSGADWQDKAFYGFLGGSKLIQEKVFTERFYLNLALCLGGLSLAAAVFLSLILKSFLIIGFSLLIIILAWSYSTRPFRFSYHRLGELIIFLLFGPASVMGGYFIQSGIFPDAKSFLLSLPFGFLTTSILFVNEVPDYPQDRKSGKLTWVSFTGQKKAYIIYYLLALCAFVAIALGIKLGYLSNFTYLSFLGIILVFKTINILEKYPEDKSRLAGSSKLAIQLHNGVSAILILSLIL